VLASFVIDLDAMVFGMPEFAISRSWP